jgi:NaMN:DMB phosphoribosyltransferase
VGDPLHISIAGFVVGALRNNSRVILAGGTQMCSVLAILKRLNVRVEGSVSIATTRWIVEDKQSDIRGLLADIAPEVGLIATTIDLGKSKYDGLRAYEQGYVKEGVGAGGLLTLAALKGYGEDEVLKLIEGEYERLMGIGLSRQSVL